MGRLATLARDHYKQRLAPEQYAQIKDPSEFFQSLEDEAMNQIEALMDDLAGKDPEGEPFDRRVGRLRMAWFNAEGLVIRELILPEPTPVPEPFDPADREWLTAIGEFKSARQELLD